ncbi:MAG: hypothetical protein N2Z80_07340 [Hydrogenothermaceae bacterium]|nr:hypothetical protein [Hydrogenothermaceae bacterium]
MKHKKDDILNLLTLIEELTQQYYSQPEKQTKKKGRPTTYNNSTILLALRESTINYPSEISNGY